MLRRGPTRATAAQFAIWLGMQWKIADGDRCLLEELVEKPPEDLIHRFQQHPLVVKTKLAEQPSGVLRLQASPAHFSSGPGVIHIDSRSSQPVQSRTWLLRTRQSCSGTTKANLNDAIAVCTGSSRRKSHIATISYLDSCDMIVQ